MWHIVPSISKIKKKNDLVQIEIYFFLRYHLLNGARCGILESIAKKPLNLNFIDFIEFCFK